MLSVCVLCRQPHIMDSDEDDWNLDDDEEVVMPRELPKGSLSHCFNHILIWF